MNKKKIITTLPPNIEHKYEAIKYLDKYAESSDLKYLRLAIKIDPLVLFSDERIKDWIYQIRYKASIPHPTKENKDARDFMEDMRLLKPEKQGEVLIFFGSGYCMESCLGIKFVPNSKHQLICYDKAAIIFFVDKLKQLWKDFRNEKQVYKFKDESSKKKMVSEFCMTIGLKISKEELKWGSIHYATDIAITILGIANMKRFKLLLSKYPKHELNKYTGKYFSFHTLHNLYKKVKNTVSSNDIIEVTPKINSAKNEDNPFVIDYSAGMPSQMYLAHERNTYFIVEKSGIRKPTYKEKIEHFSQQDSSKKGNPK